MSLVGASCCHKKASSRWMSALAMNCGEPFDQPLGLLWRCGRMPDLARRARLERLERALDAGEPDRVRLAERHMRVERCRERDAIGHVRLGQREPARPQGLPLRRSAAANASPGPFRSGAGWRLPASLYCSTASRASARQAIASAAASGSSQPSCQIRCRAAKLLARSVAASNAFGMSTPRATGMP